MTTFMTDINTQRMEEIEANTNEIARFPERYTVSLTGKALLFLKGTKYLIKNLVLSLVLAIFLSLYSWPIYSVRLKWLSSPNSQPTPFVITAGMMGFWGST